MRSRTFIAGLAAALVLSGCSFLPGFDRAEPPSGYDAGSATVAVENDGLAAVAVYSTHTQTRIGTVMPGQTECLTLTDTSQQQQLVARPVGGGEATVSPTFSADPGKGWSWRLGTTPDFDRLSLVRAEICR